MPNKQVHIAYDHYFNPAPEGIKEILGRFNLTVNSFYEGVYSTAPFDNGTDFDALAEALGGEIRHEFSTYDDVEHAIIGLN